MKMRFKFSDFDTEIGIRLAAGAAYELPKYHVEIFAELVPVFELSPDVELDLDGGIGIRYYF